MNNPPWLILLKLLTLLIVVTGITACAVDEDYPRQPPESTQSADDAHGWH